MTPRGSATPRPRAVPPSEEESVTRVLALGFAIGGLVFGVLGLPALARQWGAYLLIWDLAAVAIVFVWPLSLLAVLRRAPITDVRRLLRISAALSFLLLLTLVPAMHDPGLLPGAPWYTQIAMIGAIAISIGGRARWAWLAAIVSAAGIGAVRVHASPPGVEAHALQDTLYSALFASVFIGLILLLRDAAARMDSATERARSSARESARRTTLREEDQWLRQFLHDEVLSVLVLAGRGDTALRETARERARGALRTLRGSAEAGPMGPREGADLGVRDLVVLLQESAYEISPAIRVDADVAASWPVPPEVRHSLITAVGEALRNSMRHAEGATRRSVEVDADELGLRIAIRDDGAGFSMSDVGWDRMGVRESILANVSRIPGGEAHVDSAPGAGTLVMIRWTRGG